MNFFVQFYYCVHNVQADRAKLAILKSCLIRYALHLSLEDGNFNVAVDLLTKEFLYVLHIVNEIFKQILTTQPKYDEEFTNVKPYLSEIRADLAELRTSNGLDFF